MQVTRRSKITLRIQNVAFVVLLLAVMGLLGWLSTQYTWESDWTAGARNTLSEGSVKLLHDLKGPITITAFARENAELRGRIRSLIGRYQRVKSDVHLTFVNPDAEPQRVRQLGIQRDGELMVAYHGRSEHVRELNEQSVTNAILRASRQGKRWIVFLTGHGERDPLGRANYDLGDFGKALKDKGLTVETLNLAKTPTIPSNTSVLVIASPQVNLLPGEVKIIRHYVEKGGNLLWMAEPGSLHGLQPLAEQLGLDFLPGVIVDPTTQLFGIKNPAFVLVTDYPRDPVTRNMDTVTLFPTAAALDTNDHGHTDWTRRPILTTQARAWTETGKLSGQIRYNKGTDERPGPLNLGYALTRDTGKQGGGTKQAGRHGHDNQQRVVVVGDGDFLSNAYLGNGGNRQLGLNMVHWLGHDDSFIAIQPKSAPDRTLNLSPTAQFMIGAGFLLVIPLGLIASGVVIWLRRRKR
ncbi:MAG: Gldg family protein [Gammaproteobacteria bacterium]